jgi:hypothetical protein
MYVHVSFGTYIQDKSVTILSVCAQRYIQIQTCRIADEGRQRQRQQGARRRWRWRRQRALAWDHGWVGYGSSLGDELYGQGLGRWTSPRAGFLEDVVVECCERVAELCLKFVRGHGIEIMDFAHNNHLAFCWLMVQLYCLPTNKKNHLKIHQKSNERMEYIRQQ